MPVVTVSRRSTVAEVVIDAPPLNLVDAALGTDLEACVEEVRRLAATGEVRAMLLRAEGKVFCGGVDVHEFADRTPAQGAAIMARFLAVVQAIEALPIPTVAVVHALNLTIGLELALGCDLMWAADTASLGMVEATVGLTPGGGGTQRLAARAGVARAAEIVLTGDIYPATDFHAWGIINRLAPPAEVLGAARDYTDRLAAGPTKAAAIGKRLLAAARDQGTAAADAITASASGQVFSTEDLATGITSLLNDGPRRATFTGR